MTEVSLTDGGICALQASLVSRRYAEIDTLWIVDSVDIVDLYGALKIYMVCFKARGHFQNSVSYF